MWLLIAAALALPQTDRALWRAGWERAKARADPRNGYRQGWMDALTLMQEELKHLTPQEKAQLRRVLDDLAKDAAEHIKEHERMLKQIQEEWQQRQAKRLVSPPPPPDVK
jgi:hypothetical protein